MKKVISTRGISYHIEQIISRAKKEIILITPFLQLPKEFHKRLLDASDRGVKIIMVYGKKEELDKEQESMLLKIDNLELRYLDRLHAKVYLNELEGVIASMNLYQYSEVNNFELGVSFVNDNLDRDNMYQDTFHEVQLIISQSELKKERVSIEVLDKQEIILSLFYSENNQDILFENIPVKGISISKRYGFITYHIYENLMPYEDLKRFRRDALNLIYENVGSDYRLYWSYPYDKICIYHKKGIQFDNKLQELSYCRKVIERVNSQIKELIN
ncbi:hypothetical protein TPENAI_20036 [Tenacibaculum litopenaei]|uniref:phospholipase D-like domain-containing protein n=1 Tax=Tenacibaculum litopenaei TaxID=396016 RepID=UPI003893A5F8